MNIFEDIKKNFTKICFYEIKLHKEIKDEDIIIINNYKIICIFDKNDVVYNNNNSSSISYYRLVKTEYLEKFLRLDYYYGNVIYPYLIDKTNDEMKNEQITEVKLKNNFIDNNSKEFSFIVNLSKENGKYMINYYVNNTILNNIKNGKREYNTSTLLNIIKTFDSHNIKNQRNLQLKQIIKDEYSTKINKFKLNDLKDDIVLYNYQINDIIWMKNIENKILRNKNTICYKYSNIKKILNDEFVIINDNIILPSNIIDKKKYNDIKFKYFGGNIISEVGLGKTIIALSYIFSDNIYIKNRKIYDNFVEFSNCCNYFYKRGNKKGQCCSKELSSNSNLFCNEHLNSCFIDKPDLILKNLHNFNPDNFLINNKIKTNSTLIICPNQLCDQWIREYYDKYKNNKRIVLLITKDQFNNLTLKDILFSDIVIVSYGFLLNNHYTSLLRNLHSINLEKKFVINEDLPIDENEKIKLFLEKKEFNCLHLFKWNRIILDEAHEIYNMYKVYVLCYYLF